MPSRSTLVVLLLLAATAAAQTAGEYQVKAAFLFNFAKFVEWPAGSFKSPSDGIHICVLGDNPFGTALSDLLAGKRINDRPLVSGHFLEVKEVNGCQILFISKSERKNLRNILAVAAAGGILTVGEWDNFALDGGMIGFRLEDGKVRLEINLPAADQAQVQISSKLLSLAQIVKK
jgi:hypothetical protein